MSGKQWPYCEEPECHNSHTCQYVDLYASGNSLPARRAGYWIYYYTVAPIPGARRWCRSHALLNEGVAFG